jgi:hypothetical protein
MSKKQKMESKKYKRDKLRDVFEAKGSNLTNERMVTILHPTTTNKNQHVQTGAKLGSPVSLMTCRRVAYPPTPIVSTL